MSTDNALSTSAAGTSKLPNSRCQLLRIVQLTHLTQSNRDGIGTDVRVKATNGSQEQMLRSGSSYLSQSELVLTFGLGKADKVDGVEVACLSGRIEKFTDINASQTITIQEDKGIISSQPYRKTFAAIQRSIPK